MSDQIPIVKQKIIERFHSSPQSSTEYDSSVKRNTTFVKKLKSGVTKENAASLIFEINSLSLTKYISEIISGLDECLQHTKISCTAHFVEVAVALHLRFSSEITFPLQNCLVRGLEIGAEYDKSGNSFDDCIELTKQDLDRINRQKLYGKALLECYIIGLFEETDDIILAGSDSLELIFRNVIQYEAKYGTNVPLLSFILTSFKDYFVPSESQYSLFKALTKDLIVFGKSMSNYTIKIQTSLNNFEEKIHESSVRTGRVPADMTNTFKIRSQLVKRLKLLCDVLTETVGIPEVVLPRLKSHSLNIDTSKYLEGNIAKNGVVVWSSDEERQFYEVSGGNVNGHYIDGDYNNNDKNSDNISDDNNNKNDITDKNNNTNSNDPNETSQGQSMTTFLESLSNCITAKDVDNLSKSYWSQGLDNKASRNRLLTQLLNTDDSAFMRSCARFLALYRVKFFDFIDELVLQIDNTLRFLVYNTKIIQLRSSEINRIRLFCELIKFRLIESHVVFHKIRKLVMSFGGNSAFSLLLILFQHTGRFLMYANGEDSHEFMEEMVTILKDRIHDFSLSSYERSAINSLTLLFEPPVKIQEKLDIEDPQRKFIKAILKQLDNSSVEEVGSLVLKLDIGSTDVFSFVINVLSSPQMLKFNQLDSLARLVCFMGTACPQVAVGVIDSLVESIERGLEINSDRFKQVRMTKIMFFSKVLGIFFDNYPFSDLQEELELFFKILFKLIGHGNPAAGPGLPRLPRVEGSADYFTISLLISWIEGVIFTNIFTKIMESLAQGPLYSLKSKLHIALLFTNYFIVCQQTPLPADCRFKVHTLFNKIKSVYEYNDDIGDIIKQIRQYFASKGVTWNPIYAQVTSDEPQILPTGKKFDDQMDKMYRNMMQSSIQLGEQAKNKKIYLKAVPLTAPIKDPSKFALLTRKAGGTVKTIDSKSANLESKMAELEKKSEEEKKLKGIILASFERDQESSGLKGTRYLNPTSPKKSKGW